MCGKLRKACVGGTFDRLHKGHRAILDKAFEVGDRVVIGLTTDEFVRKYKGEEGIEPFNRRLQRLLRYLNERGYARRASVIPLNDPYGIAASDPDLEAIVVSEETAGRADEINSMRVRRGLKPLRVFIVKMLRADDGDPICSSRIRRGEIDEEGRILRRGNTRHIL